MPACLIEPGAQAEFKPRWAATTALLDYQVNAVTKLLPPRVGALFMEMGTGKTRTAIELVRLRQEKISRVIWFCPVTLIPTIRREILKHTTLADDDVYVFNGKTREQVLPMDRQFYIVGIESMSSSSRLLFCAEKLIDERACVVVDESTYIKGHAALRTKRITVIAEQARYRLILTGTPITQGVVDLYAQMRFLSPKILGYQSFYTFAANHLIYSCKHENRIVGSMDVGFLTERMKPYVYQVTKQECLTLPPKLHESYCCDLTSEQATAYHQAKVEFAERLMADLDDAYENRIEIFRLFSRLQAITCGKDGDRKLPHNRLNLLMSVIEDVQDSHTIIFCKYLQSIDEIVARFQEEERKIFVIDGRVPQAERDSIQSAWTQQGGALVLTRGLGGHGLDLTAAATCIFYSSSFKYSEHIQAEDRLHRIGQNRPVTYISLWSDCRIEDLISNALSRKENALETLRTAINKVKESGKEKVKQFVMAM